MAVTAVSDSAAPLRRLFRIRSRLARNLLAECFGTCFLLFTGFNVNAQMVLSRSAMNGNLGLILGWGLCLTFAVQICYNSSGAHFNPAVSFFLWTFGHLPALHVLLYSIVQTVGAFIAAAMTYVLYLDQIDAFDGGQRSVRGPNATAGIFATYPSDNLTPRGAIIDQIAATATLCVVIGNIGDRRNRVPRWAHPPMYGAMLAAISLGFGLNAGNAMNPARDIGPRLFTYWVGYGLEVFSHMNHTWWLIPLVGPLIGATIGAWLYQLLVVAQAHELDSDPDSDSELDSDSAKRQKLGQGHLRRVATDGGYPYVCMCGGRPPVTDDSPQLTVQSVPGLTTSSDGKILPSPPPLLIVKWYAATVFGWSKPAETAMAKVLDNFFMLNSNEVESGSIKAETQPDNSVKSISPASAAPYHPTAVVAPNPAKKHKKPFQMHPKISIIPNEKKGELNIQFLATVQGVLKMVEVSLGFVAYILSLCADRRSTTAAWTEHITFETTIIVSALLLFYVIFPHLTVEEEKTRRGLVVLELIFYGINTLFYFISIWLMVHLSASWLSEGRGAAIMSAIVCVALCVIYAFETLTKFRIWTESAVVGDVKPADNGNNNYKQQQPQVVPPSVPATAQHNPYPPPNELSPEREHSDV